jgi:spore coat protein A, manganese oxidase
MELSRRDALKLGVMGSAALMLPLERIARTALNDPLRQLPARFRSPLLVPHALRPVRRNATTDFYRITMKEAEASILPGKKTPIFGYNGQFPGPVIMAKRGRRVEVQQVNRLRVPTSIHTHGAYVDGDSDGHPLDLIQPGTSKTYIFDNEQTARTQWFHDHAMHETARNVYMGLAGIYLIEDKFEQNLPIPHGEHDIPLVIQDRLFNADGGFNYPVGVADSSTNGVLGDVVLVNGKPWPQFDVSARKYRFRILNGSNARPYELSLSNGMPLTLIATEGGLLHRPVRLRSLRIAPAERYEVVIDFSKVPVGTRVVLRNLRGQGSVAQVMRFDVVRKAKDDSRIPSILRPPAMQIDATHLPTREANSVRTRRFVFARTSGMWTINGKIFEESRIDAAPGEGDTEIWEFQNNGGGWIHPIHLHLVNFKILTRNGRRPRPQETGWKETVFLDANDTVRVLMKWPKVPIGPKPAEFVRTYVFHCHVVEHEDHDMMMQMKVNKGS